MENSRNDIVAVMEEARSADLAVIPDSEAGTNVAVVDDPVTDVVLHEEDDQAQESANVAAKEDTAPDAAQSPRKKPGPKPVGTAPVSWKPEEREHWSNVPKDARAAILRREREMDSALREASQSKHFHEEFTRSIAPYEAMIRGENATPIQAIQSLLATASALRTASASHKADLVAGMVHQFGVDVGLLDTALAGHIQGKGGAAPAPAQDALVAMLDNKLKPVLDFVGRMQGEQQAQQQTAIQRAAAEWDAFASDPKNEFAGDLRMEIADLLEFYANKGRKLPLQDAYKLATMQNSAISEIIKGREKSNGASQQTAAARRALNAAASIHGNGGAPSQNGIDESDGSLRSDLLASMQQLSSRR